SSESRRGLLPSLAAGLALLWNLGSLVVLAPHPSSGYPSTVVVALSFSVLSILPAVLLHISPGNRMRLVRLAGYLLSGVAVSLPLGEIFVPVKSSLHETALLLISAGFGSITLVVALLHSFQRLQHKDALPSALPLARIVGTMAFFLFAISFVHFGSVHGREVWSAEIALHHAGIPLALVVLLQEYHFLLMDAFLRFLANAALATGIIVAGILLEERYGLVGRAGENSFIQALVILAAASTLIAFGYLRTGLQHLLTRVVFRRPALDYTLQAIRAETIRAADITHVLNASGNLVSAYIGAERWDWQTPDPQESRTEPELVSDFVRWRRPSDWNWAEVVMPVWINRENCQCLLLGRRHGRGRYLSEDLQSLSRIAKVIAEEAERLRASEMKRLVSEAEYRALQAQINPHFLFNSLNALYGTIPRQADGARRMVLNLSQVFRYFLRSDRTTIPLSEELAIVQAYLEIEKLRLGDRLQTEINVSPEAAAVLIPVLAVQPLVENAVRHGVASKPGPGWVSVSAAVTGGTLRVEVADSGGNFGRGEFAEEGAGIGLKNVRQRLCLLYGPATSIDASSESGRTIVSFEVPIDSAETPAHLLGISADAKTTPV
ncbi:MAG: histidine kinase, partial [Bryobacteraceae bacterium]|nr:histidine kinase [Bryobacteraceae bacterium]